MVCVLFFWSPAKEQAAEEEELLFNVGTDAEAEQSDEVIRSPHNRFLGALQGSQNRFREIIH